MVAARDLPLKSKTSEAIDDKKSSGNEFRPLGLDDDDVSDVGRELK